MIAPDGREVDVDLVNDPDTGRQVEAFDAWRIRWFVDEAARGRYGEKEIISACAYLAKTGGLREVVAGRWYTLANHQRPNGKHSSN